MIACHTCQGRGSKFGTIHWDGYDALGKRISGNHTGDLTCHRCNGTGQIAPERLEWERLGKEIATRRKARRETQRTVTLRLGLQSLAEYADMEAGRIDPKPLLDLGL